jgi:hypothetical protein
MFELTDILHSLVSGVDLGFMTVPTIIFISVMFILVGLGFRRPLLSYFGATLIFAYYIISETAVLI